MRATTHDVRVDLGTLRPRQTHTSDQHRPDTRQDTQISDTITHSFKTNTRPPAEQNKLNKKSSGTRFRYKSYKCRTLQHSSTAASPLRLGVCVRELPHNGISSMRRERDKSLQLQTYDRTATQRPDAPRSQSEVGVGPRMCRPCG